MSSDHREGEGRMRRFALGNILLRSGGFTLIETVMVIVVLGIIGAGILMYFVGISGSADPVLVTQATFLAEEGMEKVIADRKANGFNSITSIPPAALPAPFSRFTKEVDVFCVQEADLDASSGTMPNCADSDIRAKRVSVVITWPGASADYVTVISSH